MWHHACKVPFCSSLWFTCAACWKQQTPRHTLLQKAGVLVEIVAESQVYCTFDLWFCDLLQRSPSSVPLVTCQSRWHYHGTHELTLTRNLQICQKSHHRICKFYTSTSNKLNAITDCCFCKYQLLTQHLVKLFMPFELCKRFLVNAKFLLTALSWAILSTSEADSHRLTLSFP